MSFRRATAKDDRAWRVSEEVRVGYEHLLLLFSVARLGLAISLRELDLRLDSTTLSNTLGVSSDAVSLRDGGVGSGFSAETVFMSSSWVLPAFSITAAVCASEGRGGRGLSSFFQK